MKSILTFIAILVTVLPIYSQSVDYNLSDYVYPDIKRQTLRLSPRLDMFSSKFQSATNSSYLNFDMPLLGTLTEYTRKKQTDLFYSARVGYRGNAQDSDSNRVLDYGGQFDIESRWFHRPKRFFELEWDSRFNSTSFLNSDNQFTESNLDVSVSPQLGFGRVEIVNDAWHAVTIVEELKRLNALQADLSHEQLTSLANQISQLRNYRHVDSRLEAIYEIENLSKYLVDNGYVESDAYRTFAVLSDLYSFENFTFRRQGKQFTVGPEVTFDFLFPGITDLFRQSVSTYALKAEYEIDNAVNMDWQFDQSYKLKAGIWNFSPLGNDVNLRHEFAEVSASYDLGYFLNQRTNMFVNAEAFYTMFRDFDTQAYGLTLTPRLVYYISPQFRLGVTGSVILTSSDTLALRANKFSSGRLTTSVNYFFY